MNRIDIAEAQCKRDEGFRANAYPDPLTHADPWTIGYGATGPGIHKGVVWTEAQAEADLRSRLVKLSATLRDKLPWYEAMDEVRAAVLLSMAYNMGVRGLLGFANTLALIHAGHWHDAAAHMLASTWAKQVGGRANRLALQISTGVQQ